MIRFFKLLNAPCRDMAALTSCALDERLTRSERFAVRSHMLYCKACRRYRRQIHLIRSALTSLRTADAPMTELAGLTLGEDARNRMISALRGHGNSD